MIEQIKILKGIHPGFYLENELRKKNLKKGTFALSLQEFPQTLVSITKGKRRMNTGLALKIENSLGLEEGFLMILQVYYDIAQKKKQGQILHPDFSIIRPVLFWDTDFKTINWQKQKRAVIQRVFERGNQIEKDEITRFYGVQTVEETISNYAE
ncbi:MAG: plasmid maintenance system antidote protein [Bacteroidetes bacterium]|nr:MAG: plasmid maintenance system antidote protein [Bacteroidota bacterium]